MKESEYINLIDSYLADQDTTVRCFEIKPLKQVVEIVHATYGNISHVNHYEEDFENGFKKIFMKHFAEPLIENIDLYDYLLCERFPELAGDLLELINENGGPKGLNEKYIRYVKEWFDNHLGGRPDSFDEWGYSFKNENHDVPDNTVKAIICDCDGNYCESAVFEGTPKNIANFIMYNSDNIVYIRDHSDNFVVSSTRGGFLDRVAYPALREEIIKEILPLQLGDIKPINVANQKSKVEKLARELDDFSFDVDFYEYLDNVEDRLEHVQEIVSNLTSGKIQPYVDFLEEIIEERGDESVKEQAMKLVGKLKELE